MNNPYMAMAGAGGLPNQINLGMTGVFENAPMFGGIGAMGGQMQPMFQGINQQAGVFQGPYSPIYPPQFLQREQNQPVSPFQFLQQEQGTPVSLPLKKPMY